MNLAKAWANHVTDVLSASQQSPNDLLLNCTSTKLQQNAHQNTDHLGKQQDSMRAAARGFELQPGSTTPPEAPRTTSRDDQAAEEIDGRTRNLRSTVVGHSHGTRSLGSHIALVSQPRCRRQHEEEHAGAEGEAQDPREWEVCHEGFQPSQQHVQENGDYLVPRQISAAVCQRAQRDSRPRHRIKIVAMT